MTREETQVPGEPAVADALTAAIAKQAARERVAAYKRKQEEKESARREEEDAVVSGFDVDLRTLRATDPGMSLLDAAEFITSDLGRHIALYRRCSAEDRNIGAAKDLALLERRAQAEGFQV
jgi:hypothetical protein